MQSLKICVAFLVLVSVHCVIGTSSTEPTSVDPSTAAANVGGVDPSSVASADPSGATGAPTTTQKPMVKLSEVYDDLPADIKAIFMKYSTNATDNYDKFVMELQNADGYGDFKQKLGIKDGDLTQALLTTLFVEYQEDKEKDSEGKNNCNRNGVTIGTVAMVTMVSMLVPYFK